MTEQNFRDFWALVLDVWDKAFLGISVGGLLTALGIFLLFVLLRNFFTRIVINQIKKLTRRTKSEIDDLIVDAVQQPIRFVPIVLGFFIATNILEADREASAMVATINRSLVAFTIFWALYRAITPIGHVMESTSFMFTVAMRDWFVKTLKVGVFLLGLASILEMWGVEVLPIVAGLGIFGVAVALGAQELFKNLIAGLFIIGERRFKNDDWIFVDSTTEGIIEQIGFRTTKIRRWDKAPLYIPNSKLTDNVVTNYSEMPFRRIFWVIGVEYRTPHDALVQIREKIEKYILDNSDIYATPDEMPTQVKLDKFNDSSIDILIYCFSRSVAWPDFLEAKQKLLLETKKIVEEAGTAFAFPSRSLYVETLPEHTERPDIDAVEDHQKSGQASIKDTGNDTDKKQP